MSEETYKLSEVMYSIKETVEQVYDGYHWMTAELSACRRKDKGYWIFELQESDEQGRKIAQTQAFVWSNSVSKVIHKFKAMTGQPLSAGMQIKVLIKIGFHPQWGLRFTIHDIDSSWTLGEAKANNKRIVDKMKSLGIWENNKKLSLPHDFYQIAVIAPDSSAGLDDFMFEAKKLENHQLAFFDIYHTPFEGNNAPKEFPKTIKKIIEEHSKKNYDALCVVRGGGAVSGIAWLDNEFIIESLCYSPIPIISGIGHERDSTLVDEMANLKCGTPSKAIQYIYQAITSQAQNTSNYWSQFNYELNQRLNLAYQNIENQKTHIQNITENLLKNTKEKINYMYKEGLNLSPQSTLKRGYCLLENSDNKHIIKSIKDIENLKKENLTLHFQDGKQKILLKK